MNNGSLVDARQNPLLYTIILIVLAAFAVLVIVGLILKKIRELHSTPEWIESHKNLATTKKNVENVANLANLSTEEKRILSQICQKFKPKNIEYLIRDEKAIIDLFNQGYTEFKSKNASQETFEMLYEVLYKLEKAHDNITFISTTRALPNGQQFTYIDSDRNNWKLTLERNEPQGLVISIPKAFAQSDKKPAQLSKFILTFKTEAGTTYTLLTRVVRYEEEKSGKFILIASSNNTLTAIQRRTSKRIHLDKECKFSAVKYNPNNKTNSYEILQNKYEGKLQNISATGCRLSCTMPIKEGQYLNVEFSLKDGQTEQSIGYIVMTKKSPDGKQYVLHIKFIDIDLGVKNRISAFVYGYDK
ncbi:MAG: PilZ domain-containing protein [Treponema sp.]|nr:PilZ domain-containing protein [Treponema sp.]